MSKNVPDAYLYVVVDGEADLCSPVFECPNDAVAIRNFRLKTVKEIPEGFDKSKFLLYRVGTRIMTDVVGEAPMLLTAGVLNE